MSWRVIADEGHREPRRNLALDEALARCADGGRVLRLWRNERCVVLGRFQLREAELDLAACRELGVPVLRRFTGGGAVFHDPGNLNATLVLGRDDPLVRERTSHGLLPGVYGALLEPLAAAVRSLAGEAAADERAVWLRGRKISGVAAWLGAHAVLIHATLLVDSDLEALDRVLSGPGAPGDPRWERTRSRRVPVTSLTREKIGGIDRIEPAILAALGVGADRATGFTAAERGAADRLLAERYSRALWHAEGR